MNHESYADTLALLKGYGIPHQGETLALEMGQPFRNIADACRFFEIYNKSGEAVTEESVRARLEATGDDNFPWYLPQPKEMGIILLDSRNIPEL